MAPAKQLAGESKLPLRAVVHGRHISYISPTSATAFRLQGPTNIAVLLLPYQIPVFECKPCKSRAFTSNPTFPFFPFFLSTLNPSSPAACMRMRAYCRCQTSAQPRRSSSRRAGTRTEVRFTTTSNVQDVTFVRHDPDVPYVGIW